VLVASIGGKVSRVPPEATAYAHRDARFVMNVHARWPDPADDKRCISWAREFFRATGPYASDGVYVNFMTPDESRRAPAAFGPNLEKLSRVKLRYDPGNLFRLNPNIMPVGR
jgi:hypothetical protein